MIEKVRVTLWDLLTFFLSGFLASIITFAHFLVLNNDKCILFIKSFKDIPTSYILFVIPIFLTLIGMLIEPLANICDKKLIAPILLKIKIIKSKNEEEKEELKSIISKIIKTEINEEITNVYHFCKDYVEQKQLTTNFMIFLARFGFYRNVSFLCFIASIISPFLYDENSEKIIASLIWLTLTVIYKKRSVDFFSYQAPTLYRCFLADRYIIKQNKDNKS
jgi:hypothetical protein